MRSMRRQPPVRNKLTVFKNMAEIFSRIPYEMSDFDELSDHPVIQYPSENGKSYIARCYAQKSNTIIVTEPHLVSYLTRLYNKHNGLNN